MSPPHRKKMRAKYTIKVPVEKISPLSFDSKGNIYFTTTDTFYRVSGRQVEQISAGNPFRQVTSESLQMGPQLANWPPLALSGKNMFLPGPKRGTDSTLSLVDSEKGPLWEYCFLGHGVGIVPCSLGGCFLLSELTAENGRQYAVEKIDHLGNREWKQTFWEQPFHTFGPPNGGDKLLFYHGDTWTRDDPIMRLVQLDADGNMICVDKFTERGLFRLLWTKEGSLFHAKIKTDMITTSYEIRKYHINEAGNYCLANQWTFCDPDPGYYAGEWSVSPSGNYLCYTGGRPTSQGHWSNKVILFSLEEQGSMKRIFINWDTPIDLSPTPHYAAPVVTDSGVVLSAWHMPKGNSIFLTDFSEPEIPTQRVRNSSKTPISMDGHNSQLYLFERAGKWLYLSVFDMP